MSASDETAHEIAQAYDMGAVRQYQAFMWEVLGPMLQDAMDEMTGHGRYLSKGEWIGRIGERVPTSASKVRVYRSRAEHVALVPTSDLRTTGWVRY